MGKTFFVTGANSGLGLAIAKAASDAGHTVLGTVRSDASAAALRKALPSVHPVRLDVTDFASIPDVVAACESGHGPVDILVNNAGYGHEGTIEESPLDELRKQFEVNVFGAVAVAKAFMPRFRERREGFIINVTSMAGMVGFPGVGYYSGSKFALQGISEVMKAEMAPFGVKVTAVCPGSFRTDWAGRSMVRTERSIADYDALFDPIREARRERSGQQAGDPARLAKAILTLIESGESPTQLLLGTDAVQAVSAKLLRLGNSINQWRALSRSTDGDWD